VGGGERRRKYSLPSYILFGGGEKELKRREKRREGRKRVIIPFFEGRWKQERGGEFVFSLRQGERGIREEKKEGEGKGRLMLEPARWKEGKKFRKRKKRGRRGSVRILLSILSREEEAGSRGREKEKGGKGRGKIGPSLQPRRRKREKVKEESQERRRKEKGEGGKKGMSQPDGSVITRDGREEEEGGRR